MVTKLTRDKAMPFLDKNKGVGTAEYVRIGRSTIFKLDYNADTTDVDFIMYATKQTELNAYKPSMDQEIALYEGDSCYDFLAPLAFALDVNDSTIPLLLCFPGTPKLAWRVPLNQIVFNDSDFASGKIEFTCNLNGDIEKGTYTITDGVPTFVASQS